VIQEVAQQVATEIVHHTNNVEWILYCLGATLGLVQKALQFLYDNRKDKKSTGKLLLCWAFAHEEGKSAVSWCITFAIVWVMGSVLINEGHHWVAEWLPDTHGRYAIALLAGAMAEFKVPMMTKFVISKFKMPWESKNTEGENQ